MFMLLTTVNMPNKKMAGATPLSPTYLNSQAVPHFKHTSRTSKLLHMSSKEMKVTWQEIGAVGLGWYIIYRP